MTSLRRAAPAAAIALVLGLAVAAPAAASQPIRTVMSDPPATLTLDAGRFCPFTVVTDRPMGRRFTVTEFSDGREQVIGLAVQRTYSNPANGKSFVAQTSGHEVDWFDAYPMVHGTVQGTFVWTAPPGDVFSGGVVIDHLTQFYIQGSVTYVTNWETGATSQFSMTGTATDICAAML